MSDRLHLLGIRHHGPGSAAAVLRALEAARPEIVLIEGPADATGVATLAGDPGMKPPVALLAYWEADPSLATFYPFSEYAPEWQAIRWATAAGRPFRLIDIPAMHLLAGMAAEKDETPAVPTGREVTDPGVQPSPADWQRQAIAGDPIGFLARLAGDLDGDGWWTRLVESGLHAPDLFAAIEEAMTDLRTAAGSADRLDLHGDDLWNERREAHMRLAIRTALRETEGAVAVVCGAWHVPALRRRVAVSEDRKLLKGLPKGRTVITWSPWTDRRLASGAGYGAGMASPGWFRHLWGEMQQAGEDRVDARRLGVRWQTQVAALLRAEGQTAGTASVIESVRLAESLAALRRLSMPGLTEFRDATLATLCHGDPITFDLIEQRLVIGTRVGIVTGAAPQPPLLADLALQQKRLQLDPEALDKELKLDLRSKAGLAKSGLLHRLDLLGVPWGVLTDAGKGRGSFRELWVLRWEPEFSVRLAEATVYGATVAKAATAAALEQAEQTKDLPALARLVQRCLVAGLDRAGRALIRILDERAVEIGTVKPLLDAVPELVGILRYGTARRMPTDLLEALVGRLAERSFIGLLHACRGLDADEAAAMRTSLTAFDEAARLFPSEELRQDWQRALKALVADDMAVPSLRGFAARALYDQNAVPGEEIAKILSRGLSRAVPVAEAAGWAEGFLEGAATILLHDRVFFDILDGWLTGLDEESYLAQLPLLRRIMHTFDATERRRLWEQVTRPAGDPIAAGIAADDPAAFEAALPLLRTILGVPS